VTAANNAPPQKPPAVQLGELATGYFRARALWAAAALDVAGALARGPLRAADIAAQSGAHGPTLYRVLRALATLGVFEEDSEGRFCNTPISELLRSDAPGSMRDLVMLFGHETSWRAWEAIDHTLRTGETAFDRVYGEKFFHYLERTPETAALFDRAMVSASNVTNAAVVDAYDFSACASIVDVAGGVGAALCAILHATPGLRGILFDLPHVAQRAREYVAGQGLSTRCEFVAGSFLEEVPGGADVYFMKHILHDWDDASCLTILRRCHAALRAEARLLICERVVPRGNEPSQAKWVDLHMMLTTHGGKERTEAEYRALLADAGLALARVIQTGAPHSLLEAVRAG
jgi:hypothetical protein